MDKTIKQIADEYGVTKQAIRKHLAELSEGSNYVGTNKTIYVTTKGQKELEKRLKRKVSTEVVKVDSNLVETLKQQIVELQKDKAFLMEQIEIKDRQIEDTQRAFQVLQLQLEDKSMVVEEQKPKRWKFWKKKEDKA